MLWNVNESVMWLLCFKSIERIVISAKKIFVASKDPENWYGYTAKHGTGLD